MTLLDERISLVTGLIFCDKVISPDSNLKPWKMEARQFPFGEEAVSTGDIIRTTCVL